MGKLKRNVITGFGGQFIAIVLGLIIPRIFISNYGSDINGLISTISQIFAYMALLEAGIGAATQNALYKPFQENDKEEVSSIASVARSYFRKVTIIYGIGVVVLSLVLPLFLKTDVDALTIFYIVIFEGMSGVVSFYYIQTPTIILNVDGKSYINNGITLANKIIGYVVKIIMVLLGMNIVLVYLAFFMITVGKVFVYSLYFKKKYDWLRFDKSGNNVKLKDRNSYIIIEICWTIFSSTDMIVLSILVSTQMSSVYGVYNMIFSNISVLLNAVYTSTVYLLGQSFHENRDKYILIHDAFNSIYIGLMTSLMIVCYYLTIPFVSLYTKGISDVSYIFDNLPLMFCLVQLLSWSRYVSGNLIGLAGRVKKAVWVNVVEACINILLSILFVQSFGIVGVLLATVVALPIKLIYCNYIGDEVILNRSCWRSISIIGTNFILFFIAVLLKNYCLVTIENFSDFIIWGIIIFFISIISSLLLNIAVNPQMYTVLLRFVRKRSEKYGE